MKAVIGDYQTAIFLSADEFKEYCRPGEGANTCVWSVVGTDGFECCYYNKPLPLLKRWEDGQTVGGRFVMRLNRQKVIERLKAGENLEAAGNTMMFPNGDFCTAATEVYLRENGLVEITGGVGCHVYSWSECSKDKSLLKDEEILELGFIDQKEVLGDAHNVAQAQLSKLLKAGYLSPEEVEDKVKGIRKEKDTQWHDNVQRVKGLIKEGKNPQEEKDNNLAYDHYHPELALLWEIALEALEKEGGG